MDEHNLTGQATPPDPKYTPLEMFNVDPGKAYRFRVISAASRCPFQISVDNHDLLVIATDGAPLKPVAVRSMVIHTGKQQYISKISGITMKIFKKKLLARTYQTWHDSYHFDSGRQCICSVR